MFCPVLKTARVSNAAVSFPYQPIAVFVGGTAGIGEAMVRAFAKHTGGNARIIIIGRNRTAAETIIASLPKLAVEQPEHEFVPCDISLMRNVRKTTADLLERLPRINYLVVTSGFLSTKREETDEGIEKLVAVSYYGRWRMFYDLMPLLRNAKDAGQAAKAMSVLHAGAGKPIDLNDLGLKSASFMSAGQQLFSYNDLMVESFAELQPEMTFSHTFPGWVRTNVGDGLKSHWALRIALPLFDGLSHVLGVSPEECAEYMLYSLYNSAPGAVLVGSNGNQIQHAKGVNTLEAREKLWEHSLKITSI